jgi:tetrahydrodipicolinate N-succinyltransferase
VDVVVMKGQIFLLTSLFFVVILILISITTRLPFEKETTNLHDMFSNLKSELTKTVDLSLLNNQNIANNLDSFILFTKEINKRRNIEENTTYSIENNGNVYTVYINVSLASENQLIKDSFIVDRTVYV